MTFPTTSLLDDFNRGALGANWTTGLLGWSAPVITSNQINASVAGFSGARWNVATYGPNCEVYISVGADNSQNRVLIARGDANDATISGYEVTINSGAFCNINRLDGGAFTKLGGDFSITGYGANSQVGLEVSGNTISVYHKASGGSWTFVTSQTDSTYTGAGYLAWGGFTGALDDNFSGGTIGAAGGAFAPVAALQQNVPTMFGYSDRPQKWN